MVYEEIVLKNEEGLHARPATEIAKSASKYECMIKLNINGNEYNAKSVLNIMSAGIKDKTPIKIICDGKDEGKALTEMINIFKSNSLV